MTTQKTGWTYECVTSNGTSHRATITSTLYNDNVVLATAFELDGINTTWRGEIVRKGYSYSNRVEWWLLDEQTRVISISRTRREALELAGNQAVALFNAEVHKASLAAHESAAQCDWVSLVNEARASRAAAVAARSPQAVSLSFLAQDFGIVPHPESTDCKGCPAWQEANRKAAALIQWEYSHPWATVARQHLTAYETVVRA